MITTSHKRRILDHPTPASPKALPWLIALWDARDRAMAHDAPDPFEGAPEIESLSGPREWGSELLNAGHVELYSGGAWLRHGWREVVLCRACPACEESGRIELDPFLDLVLLHGDSFPGCAASAPCACPAGRGGIECS